MDNPDAPEDAEKDAADSPDAADGAEEDPAEAPAEEASMDGETGKAGDDVDKALKDADVPSDQVETIEASESCVETGEACRTACLATGAKCREFWKAADYDWTTYETDNKKCLDDEQSCGNKCNSDEEECGKAGDDDDDDDEVQQEEPKEGDEGSLVPPAEECGKAGDDDDDDDEV